MPKRDPKTGRFVSSGKAKKKTAKKKSKPLPQRREKGKFAAPENLFKFGDKYREEFILRERWDPIKEQVEQDYKENNGAEPAEFLETFSNLSDNAAHALLILFVQFPKYNQDESDGLAFYATFLGPGLELIRKVNSWISDGAVIGSIESRKLSDQAWIPEKPRPFYNNETVQTESGDLTGAGERTNQNSKTRRMDEFDTRKKRKKPRKRDRKREKDLLKARRDEAIKKGLPPPKRNKGNVKEQKRRWREKQKAKKKNNKK